MQGRRLDAPVLPVHPALASLLPGGGLRPAPRTRSPRRPRCCSRCSAAPSQAGSWCGVVGMPRARRRSGRGAGGRSLAARADPRPRIPVAGGHGDHRRGAARGRRAPAGRATDAEVSRLAARLRDRGAVLLVQGPWPQAEAVLDVGDPAWTGRRARARLSRRRASHRDVVEPPHGRAAAGAAAASRRRAALSVAPDAFARLPPPRRAARGGGLTCAGGGINGSAPVRSLVLWFPDWPVTALTRDAAQRPLDAALPIAVMEHEPRRRLLGGRTRRRRAPRAAPARCAGAVPGADRDRGRPGARSPRLRAGRRRASKSARPGCRSCGPGSAPCAPAVPRATTAARPRRRTCCSARCRARGRGRAGGHRRRAVHGRAGGAHGGDHGRARRSSCPAGGAAGFLAPLPDRARSRIAELRRDCCARGSACRPSGEFAALEADRVRERFGERGIRLHALAAGAIRAPSSRARRRPSCTARSAFEPPLERADQVAFGMRDGGRRVHRRARRPATWSAPSCGSSSTGDRGERSERVWLHPAVVQRGRRGRPGAVAAAGQACRAGCASGGRAGADRARRRWMRHRPPRAGDLGAPDPTSACTTRSRACRHARPRGVVTPAIGGGRWLAERQVLVPWGDRAGASRSERARSRGRGACPSRCPATVFADPVPVAGDGRCAERAVDVDERGRVTAAPGACSPRAGDGAQIEAWAGPWPVDRALVGCRARPSRAPVPGRRRRADARGCSSARATAGGRRPL